jgi:hypothetical protein
LMRSTSTPSTRSMAVATRITSPEWGDIELHRAVRVSQRRLSKCIVFEFNLMCRVCQWCQEQS